MRRNKVLILMLTVFVVAVAISFIFFSCSKEGKQKDKFVGTWYKDGVKDAEITKNGNKYKYQTYSENEKGNKVEKGALYKNGYISKEGYLVFDEEDRYYGFEYKNDKEIIELTFFKPDSHSSPSESEKHENWVLKRTSK